MGKLITQLSFILDRDEQQVINLINAQRNNYKVAYIPKKDGTSRKVYLPIPELKIAQHFIVETYLSNITISKNANAYVKKKSILNNAKAHLGNQHYLFIDVHDFFNSIDYEILKNILYKELENYLSKEDIDFLLDTCSLEKQFVQGCVSSPSLSNIYMKDIDNKILNLVSSLKNGVYTRYSDDITISSSENIPEAILYEIMGYLREYKLFINKKKTHFSSYIENVKITGLKVNEKVSIDHNLKRKIKNMVYLKIRYKDKSKMSAKEVIGYLNFVKSIDTAFYKKIMSFYASKGIDLISELKSMSKIEI